MSTRDFFYPKGATEARIFAREKLVYNVTEDLLVFLEDVDINKKELARRLGKSKSYVTQVLSGSRNMTLGSFSDICFALGFEPKITIPLRKNIDEYLEPVEKEWKTIDSVVNKKYVTAYKVQSHIIDKKDPEHWEKAA